MGTEGLTIADAMALAKDGDCGFGGNGAWVFFLFFLLAWGGNGFWGNNRNGIGDYATAASQQEILFGQQFQHLDSKMDRIANGICDSTYALNNTIVNGATNVAREVNNEGRGIQMQLANCCCENKEATAQVRFDMANYNAATAAAIHAEGEATRALLQQNKIEALQGKINQLELQSAMCGVVRYPQASTYAINCNPFCNCGANNVPYYA